MFYVTRLLSSIGHDFFEQQPIKDAAVYLLRFVLHDWPDEPARKIMKQLRCSAAQDTKMILLEWIVPYTCAVTDEDSFADIPGVKTEPVPYPLLPSLGPATSHIYFADMRVSFL